MRAKLRLRGVASSWLSLALVFCASAPTAAQEATPTPAAPAEAAAAPPKNGGEAPGPADPYDRGTPRGAVNGFLRAAAAGDWERAANYIDLRRLPAENREAEGPALARELKFVLDRTTRLDPDAFSPSNDGAADDGLPAWRDRLARIETPGGPVELLLQRVPRAEDGVRIWQVAAATADRVPALYEELGYGVLEEVLPAPFFELRFLEVELWQWCGLMFVAFGAWLLSFVLSSTLIRLLHALTSRTANKLDDRIVYVVQGPVRLALAVGVFAAGRLPLNLTLGASDWLRGLEKVLVIVSASWLVLRLIDLAALMIRQRLIAQGEASVASLLAPGSKVVKAVVLGFGLLAILASLGVNVTAAIAGLGVGGIAVALAAQKTIENLFGGLTLLADRPVRVGDFCRFGDQVGTVEEIGLRSTRIRTLDRTLVTIPNAEFSQIHLENFAARDQIRLFATLGLRYETTPEQLRYVLARLREMLLAHPKITPDPARVRFIAFGAYSLDLEIFAYARTADWNEFLALREDIYLRVMDIVAESGTGFAFPSQTMYLGRDGGLDEKRSRRAEERVQAWRSEGDLPFPNFSETFRREVADTLDWPPRGSPGGPRGNGGRGRQGSDET